MKEDTNKHTTDDAIVNVLAELISNDEITSEKVKELCEKAHKKVRKDKEAEADKMIQDHRSKIISGVEKVLESKCAKIIIAASDTDDEKIEQLTVAAKGPANSCLALLGTAVIQILNQQDVPVKVFCDSLIDCSKNCKEDN